MEVLHTQIRLYAEQGKADQAIPLCDQIVAKLHNTAAYAMRAQVYVTLRLSTQRQYALKPYDPKQYEKTLRDLDEKALADFGQIITLDPQKVEGWAARADFYRVSGRVREGLTDVRKALELAPDNLAFQKLAALLMIASGESSLLSEAGALLDKALAAFDQAPPTNAEEARMRDYAQLRLLKAQILMSKGTGPGIESARRLLREVTASEPKMAEGWQWLARLELSQEDPARAAAAALQGLTDNPDNGDLLLLKARAEKVHQPSVAALTLKGLLDQNPDSIEVVVELADAYARCGRTQQAVDLLRQKVPELGGLARRRCEIAEAEALYANGQREEAKTLFAQLSQAEPNDPTPTMSLAQQLRRERRWTEMNQLVRRWLSVHPQDAGVATAIARVLAATGDKQAFLMGEDILRTTLEHNPRSLPALLLLAMMMQNVDRNEEAAKLNRQILEMDPQSVVALNNLAWILADQENQPQQYPEALKLAQRGLDIAPDYGDLLDTRGYAFFRLGEFEKALADFGKCIELYPANAPSAATPYFHQAMTYAAMKRTAEAVQCLQKALGLDRTSLRIAKEQADAGHVTYAVKLLKDTLQLHDQMETLRTTLLPADSPALSPQDLADAKGLLEQLQKGI
jgi:tetratricopeptide (TPR) repeat protein